MKKLLLSTLLFGLVAMYIFAQPSVLYFDFESSTPEFINSGGSWEGAIANPSPDAVNGSATVGSTLTGGAAWDGITYNFPAPLDFRNEYTFTMLVYHPDSIGETRLHFKGDGELKLDVMYTTPGEWALITWEMPEENRDKKYTSVLLCFAHERSNDGELWLFDELRGAPTSTPLEPASYFSTVNNRKDWTGFENATYEGVVPNPSPNSIHDAPFAGKSLTGTAGWSGMYIDLAGPIDFTETQLFQMKVLSDSVGMVRLQLEGTTPKYKVNALYDTPGEWKWLFFKMEDAFEGDTSGIYERIVIIFDDQDTDSGEEWYFDELRGPVMEIGDVDPVRTYVDFDQVSEEFYGFQAAIWGGVMENPSKDDVNGSDSVGLSYTGSATWSGIYYDLANTVDFSEGFTFSMKVYNPDSVGVARITLEKRGDSNNKATVLVPYTTPGEWQEITLDYRNSISAPPYNDFYNRLVVIFDYEDVDIGEEWYFDDIMGPKLTPVYYTDGLFKVTVTNSDAASFEIDINNSGTMIMLYDDGTNGDETAADGIWSAEVANLPVGDHVMDLYADGVMTSSDDVPFTIMETLAASVVEYSYDGAVSVEESAVNGFIIYPNPANDHITVIMSEGMASEIVIYNVVGAEMRNLGSVNESEFLINISDLESGIYFMRVVNDQNRTDVVKFIKN